MNLGQAVQQGFRNLARASMPQQERGPASSWMAEGENYRVPRFLSNKVMSGVVGAELREKIENPIKFQWGTGGADQPPTTRQVTVRRG